MVTDPPADEGVSTRRRGLATLGAAGGPLAAGCRGIDYPDDHGPRRDGDRPGQADASRRRIPGGSGDQTGDRGAIDPRFGFGFVGARGEAPPIELTAGRVRSDPALRPERIAGRDAAS